MRRYVRRQNRPRTKKVKRYTRPYRPYMDIKITSVDEVSVAKFNKALRRRSIKPLLGSLGDLSLILRTHYENDTLMVLHLVISRKHLEIKHYGMGGLKGWDLEAPDLIEFIIGNRKYEFDLLKATWRVKNFKR